MTQMYQTKPISTSSTAGACFKIAYSYEGRQHVSSFKFARGLQPICVVRYVVGVCYATLMVCLLLCIRCYVVFNPSVAVINVYQRWAETINQDVTYV